MNKTLMFGFMYIEKGLSWYKKILNLTLPEPRDIKINPKNCIGTVLSLNGHRRYFCMYHAKHPEATRRPGYYTASGAFMGFDSENDSSDGELDLERAAAQPAPVLDSPDHLHGIPSKVQPEWLKHIFILSSVKEDIRENWNREDLTIITNHSTSSSPRYLTLTPCS